MERPLQNLPQSPPVPFIVFSHFLSLSSAKIQYGAQAGFHQNLRGPPAMQANKNDVRWLADSQFASLPYICLLFVLVFFFYLCYSTCFQPSFVLLMKLNPCQLATTISA